MRFLITGHMGFVGRNLVKRLRDNPEGHSLLLTEQFHAGCIEDKNSHYGNFDVIVHLGANIVNVDDRKKIGIKAYNDIVLDMNVCKYVENHPPNKAFIVMSSCAIDRPEDPYCTVKTTLESFARNLHSQGVPVVILRPFSGYGPDQSPEYPFRAILDRIIDRQDPLTVWGGSQVRDWIHIDDIVDAIIYAIDGFPRGTPIQIGTGYGTSIVDLATKMSHAWNPNYTPRIHGDLSKEISSGMRIADTYEAGMSGWAAKIDLDTGIKMCIDKIKSSNS